MKRGKNKEILTVAICRSALFSSMATAMEGGEKTGASLSASVEVSYDDSRRVDDEDNAEECNTL